MKELQVKNITDRTINVNGIPLGIGEAITAPDNQEIQNLIKNGYIGVQNA
jgi:hypothetical protein